MVTLQYDLQRELSCVLRQCSNLKVNINAATALSTPAGRDAYGPPAHLSALCDGLVTALVRAEQISDFGEYKYKEDLLRQASDALLATTTMTS